VRLSILAAAQADTPYTLMQISQTPRSINLLADGAGHTFLNAIWGADLGPARAATGSRRSRGNDLIEPDLDAASALKPAEHRSKKSAKAMPRC
jgi:hypothetical protein